MSTTDPAPDASQYVPCDLCGSDDCEVYLEPRRMRSLADSDFTVLGEQGEHPRIVRCRACGLIYANPRDAAEGLVGKYKALPISSYLQEESSRRLTASRDAALLRKHVPPPARVLDVGCSAGLFLDCLGGDFERYGIEPGQESAAVARKLIGEKFIHNGTLETADFPAGSFDAVTMWDVIEHLVSPRQSLQKTAALLKTGGCLIVMTPNIASLFARMLGHRWPHLIRSHIYYFTRPALERMLNECGFAVESWGSYSRRFTIRYLFQRAGLLKAKPQDPSAPRPKPGLTVPVNFFDAMLAIARKK